MNRMKRIISVFLCFCMAAVYLPVGTVRAEESVTIQKLVEYKMTEARAMLQLINNARTEANTEAIDGITDRPMLTIDAELEKTALLRAAEVAVSFSHTRPDGSRCFSANSAMMAENLAAGSSSYKAAFQQWYSEKSDYLQGASYSDAGHYANMINRSYQGIGIGGVYCKGTAYGYYWEQCFSTNASATTLVTAYDGQAAVPIVVSSSFRGKGDTIPAGTPTYEQVCSGTANTAPESKTNDTTQNDTETAVEENTNTADTTQPKKPGKVKIKALSNKKRRAVKITISVGKKNLKGIEIRYSTKKSMKQYQAKQVSKSKLPVVTISKLKKGKTYYVKVRAYNKVNGEKCYGAWSARKTIKIKK